MYYLSMNDELQNHYNKALMISASGLLKLHRSTMLLSVADSYNKLQSRFARLWLAHAHASQSPQFITRLRAVAVRHVSLSQLAPRIH